MLLQLVGDSSLDFVRLTFEVGRADVRVRSNDLDDGSRRVEDQQLEPARYRLLVLPLGIRAAVVDEHNHHVSIDEERQSRPIHVVAAEVVGEELDSVLRAPRPQLGQLGGAVMRRGGRRGGCSLRVSARCHQGAEQRRLAGADGAEQRHALSLAVRRPSADLLSPHVAVDARHVGCVPHRGRGARERVPAQP